MILQSTYTLEETNFGLTLTDSEPTLWKEVRNKRQVIFSGDEEAAELIEEYQKLLQQASEEFDDRFMEEMFIRKGVENILKSRYNLSTDFDDSQFEEFDTHILGTLLKQYSLEVEQAA